MRLPLIPSNELSPQQKDLYDSMRKGIASNFNAFKVEREDGALMGPWNPWLHEPGIGKVLVRAQSRRHAARAAVPAGDSHLRPARYQRADLSGWPVRAGVDHA